MAEAKSTKLFWLIFRPLGRRGFINIEMELPDKTETFMNSPTL